MRISVTSFENWNCRKDSLIADRSLGGVSSTVGVMSRNCVGGESLMVCISRVGLRAVELLKGTMSVLAIQAISVNLWLCPSRSFASNGVQG